MQITQTETDHCKLLIQVEADQNEIDDKRNEVITHFKTRNIKGFRPGHAPLDAVKIQFRKEIEGALQQKLAESAYEEAVSQHNIRPFGQPHFTFVRLEGGKFSCEFALHKQPDFELGTYKSFDIPKPTGIMPANELSQKMLQELREKNANTRAYGEDDFIQMNDNVILDFTASIDGVVLDDVKAEGKILTVGKIGIPGFSENILGMKPGETREFELFIQESLDPKYANKVMKFNVKLIMGSKVEPIALDDELARKVGLKDLNELVEKAGAMASNRVVELEKGAILDQISRRLIEGHDFKIPSWISLPEAQINVKNNQQDWSKLTDEQKEQCIQNAENSIKLSLVLEKVRDNEPDAQLSSEELLKIAQTNLAQHTADPGKVMEELYKNGHLPIFLNRIKDEYCLDFISKNCNIVE
jgi:trigger factor